MINKSSVRSSNKEKFYKCIELRKQGLSYSEIRKIVPLAKSTLNNWLTLAGLTLSKEHLKIQAKKRLENHVIATEASRVTRARKAESEINKFIQEFKIFLNDPFFVAGVMLYEAEGSKADFRFSNSDYRMIQLFVNFLEKYFSLNRKVNMRFNLYIHATRKEDLEKIKNFWAKKLLLDKDAFVIRWKNNIVTHRRNNPDYVGQILVRAAGIPYSTRKILALSDIILKKYCRVV